MSRQPFRFRSLTYPVLLFAALASFAIDVGQFRRDKEQMEQHFAAQRATLQSILARVRTEGRWDAETIEKELQMVDLLKRPGAESLKQWNDGKVSWADVFPGYKARQQANAKAKDAASGESSSSISESSDRTPQVAQNESILPAKTQEEPPVPRRIIDTAIDLQSSNGKVDTPKFYIS